MKEVIIQGLRQAYSNLVHMFAEFLPRLLVMLVIVLVGLVVAYLLKMILRTVLHVTRLDRLSEEAGGLCVVRPAAGASPTWPFGRARFSLVLGRFVLFVYLWL